MQDPIRGADKLLTTTCAMWIWINIRLQYRKGKQHHYNLSAQNNFRERIQRIPGPCLGWRFRMALSTTCVLFGPELQLSYECIRVSNLSRKTWELYGTFLATLVKIVDPLEGLSQPY
jgi:hypothetical protein